MIKILREGSRLDVILNNPDRLNAMTEETWQELAEAGRQIPADIRVVVLRAEGRSFSAGLDREVFQGKAKPDLSALLAGSDEEVQNRIRIFQDAFTCWRTTHAITIAQVQGDAVGAGFQLALACDFRIAAENARFSLRETSLGLVPDLAGTKPLTELVGYSLGLQIALFGKPVEASKALQLGLVNDVVAVSELSNSVDEFVIDILALPTESVEATKRLLQSALINDYSSQTLAERQEQSKLLRYLVGR